MVVCPRCGTDEVDSLGRVRSALEWHHCRRCRHVWPERDQRHGHEVPDPAAIDDPVTCGKCGQKEARVIGRSGEFVYLQCTACGHTSIRDNRNGK